MGLVAQTWNPSIWEVEAEGSVQIQGHPDLQSEFYLSGLPETLFPYPLQQKGVVYVQILPLLVIRQPKR